MSRLRIVAGELGGRYISADVGRATHPMGDRVRSALFGSLTSQGLLRGAMVLDTFAGTGAVGLEALSRGTASVTMIEQDRVACRVVQHNIADLGVGDRVKLIQSSVANWLSTVDQVPQFDLIFADPPYQRLQLATIQRLLGLLKPTGRLILSCPTRLASSVNLAGAEVIDCRTYGEATIITFQLVGQHTK